MTELADRIRQLSEQPAHALDAADAEAAVHELLSLLNEGKVRSATPLGDGQWETQAWVKQGILLGFRIGQLTGFPGETLTFFDKHTYPLKPLTIESNVRVVPGGSSIRTGSYVAPGVVCMPPMYINVGAYVDEGSMVDSHALVGSCAQIGKRVHLSAAVQIGGVLEPVGAMPVVIEDDVFLGGGCGVYEGCIVHRGAVLAPGVVLTAATRIYDLVNDTIISRAEGGSLEVPQNAVMVPGSRSVNTPFAKEHGISLYAPIIVKYRDERTDASTTLETALR